MQHGLHAALVQLECDSELGETGGGNAGEHIRSLRALQHDPALLNVKGEDLEDYLRERNARYADIQLLEVGLRKIVAAVGPEQELPLPV